MFPHIFKQARHLLALTLASCGPMLGGQPTIPASGIEGYVSIGPQCPETPDSEPCPDAPFATSIQVETPTGERVAEVKSNAEGHFRLPLDPGDYVLLPQPTNVSFPPEQPVTVVPGQFVSVTITYDSGIR